MKLTIMDHMKRGLILGFLVSAMSVLSMPIPSSIPPASRTRQSTTKLMEFTGFGWEDVMSRLDYLDEYLHNHGNIKAYIFVYGGKVENGPESLGARMRCVDDYLGNRRHTPRVAFQVLKGGYRQHQTIEFWISPLHDPQPEPTPTITEKSVKYKSRHDKTVRFLCNN